MFPRAVEREFIPVLPTPPMTGFDWKSSFDGALSQAKREKKIVFLLFVSDGEGWSKKFVTDVLDDWRVQQKLSEFFVGYKTDVKSDLSAKFDVRGSPVSIFLDYEGNKLFVTGSVKADVFLEVINRAIDKAGLANVSMNNKLREQTIGIWEVFKPDGSKTGGSYKLFPDGTAEYLVWQNLGYASTWKIEDGLVKIHWTTWAMTIPGKEMRLRNADGTESNQTARKIADSVLSGTDTTLREQTIGRWQFVNKIKSPQGFC